MIDLPVVGKSSHDRLLRRGLHYSYRDRSLGPLATSSLDKREKKKVKKIATNKANQAIDRRAPGLFVGGADTAGTANTAFSANTAGIANTAGSANSAGNADKVDGQDASAFTPAGEVHSSGRLILNDPVPDDFDPQSAVLFVTGAFSIEADCYQDFAGASSQDFAHVLVLGPNGSSFSGTRSDGSDQNEADDNEGRVVATPANGGNLVQSGHLTAVAPNGQVVSVSASGEVNDAAGDCIFGVTAIGP